MEDLAGYICKEEEGSRQAAKKRFRCLEAGEMALLPHDGFFARPSENTDIILFTWSKDGPRVEESEPRAEEPQQRTEEPESGTEEESDAEEEENSASSFPKPKRAKRMSSIDQAILKELGRNQTPDVPQTFGNYVAAELRDLSRHQQKWAKAKIVDVLQRAADIPPFPRDAETENSMSD